MKERKKKKQKGRRKERKEERGKKVLSYAKVLTSINRRNDKIRKSLFDKYDNNWFWLDSSLDAKPRVKIFDEEEGIYPVLKHCLTI